MRTSSSIIPVGFHKFGIIAGWVAIFALAAWILVPRLVIGTTVPVAWIMTIVLPILLIVLGSITLGLPTLREQVPSKRAVGWLWLSFLFAAIVGLFLPDNTIFSAGNHDNATALVAVLFGAHWEGAGSAIANPAAILMGVSGALASIFSALDSRPGGPIRTDDEDHLQGYGHFAILGEDEYYQR